jgi:hypothetical protein
MQELQDENIYSKIKKRKDWKSLLVTYTKIQHSRTKYCFETKGNLIVFSVMGGFYLAKTKY